jgi:hypothetical protein
MTRITEENVMELARTSSQKSGRGKIGAPFLLLATVVLGCSIYANLSFFVENPVDYKYFPPFQAHLNLNMNDHLGAEYFNIARSLRAGEGFSHPFAEKTGPTAWMPPVLSMVLAALLWVCGDDRETVMVAVVVLQCLVLAGTGLLVLALTRRTTRHIWLLAAAALFILSIIMDFFLWFQFTHDSWLVLLALDLVVAGFCWLAPVRTRARGAGWGLFGGLCALISPVVGFAWASATVLQSARKRAWGPLIVAGACSMIAVTPWLVRNYLVFGVWIPVKSNLAYELFQSQIVEPKGLVHSTDFDEHPFTGPGSERCAYREQGEIAFMKNRGLMFRQAVQADPADFAWRAGNRFLAATLWYEPFWTSETELMPAWVWLRRVVHPFPALALLLLIATSFWRPLSAQTWLVISLYIVYLLPFIAITYYDRYAVPLLAAKVLLVVWAGDRILSWIIRPQRPTFTGSRHDQFGARTSRKSIEIAADAAPAIAGH